MPKSGEHKVGNIDSFFRQRPSINNVREGELITFLEDGKLIKQEKRNGVVYQSEFSEAIPRLSTEEVEAGVIREIIAGAGLTGGGIGGDITLNVGAGTHITVNSNDIAVNTSTLFASPTFTGTAQGANLTLTGDLTVGGTTTTLNAQNLQVKDKNIVLNYLDGDASSTADGAGITIQDAVNSLTDATILWDATNNEFDFSDSINVTGNISLSGTVDGRDLATDGSKLDGIEALADVTDTTNVTAAGALMDSEVDADIKTLSLPASTTISSFAKTYLDDGDTTTFQSTIFGTTDVALGGQEKPRVVTLDYKTDSVTAIGSGDNFIIIDASDNYDLKVANFPTIIGTTGTINANEFARFTNSTTLEALTASETVTALGLDDVPTVSSGSNDRIATFTGASALQGEANLTFNSSSVLYVNGSVGIGATSPSASLEISKAGGEYLDLDISGISSGTSKLRFLDGGAAKFELRHFAGSVLLDANLSVYDHNTSSEALTVQVGGNVGIGTNSPSALLDVGGDADEFAFIGRARIGFNAHSDWASFQHRDSATGTGFALLQNTSGRTILNSASGQQLQFRVNNADGTQMIFDGSQLGIGNVTPQAPLHIGTGNTSRHIKVSDSRAMFGYDGSNAVVQGGNTKGIQFHTNTDTFSGSAKMTITSAGNVGIGVTSPLATLDLGNATGERMYVYSNGSAVRAGFGVDLSGSSRELSIFHSSSNQSDGNISFGHRYETGGAYTERMRITGAGNVGIGTVSPSKKFVVKGASGDQARFEHNGAVGAVDIYSGTDGGLINIRNSAGTSVINLDARTSSNSFYNHTGNFGIGNASPAYKLDVSGDARFTGSLITEGPDGGGFIGNWAASSSFVAFGTANMSGSEYSLLTNGTNTFIGAGTGGSTYIRGPSNDSSPQLVINGTNIYMQNAGNFGIGTASPSVKLDVAGGDIAIDATQKLYLDGGGSTYITETAGDLVDMVVGGVTLMRFEESGTDSVFTNDNVQLGVGVHKDFVMYHNGTHNYAKLANGNLYFTDESNNNILIVYREGGGIQLTEGDLKIPATSKLYLDGGGNTYIDEPSGDQLRLVAGGTEVLKGYSGGAIDMYGSNIDRNIQIGANRTGNANSYIDFIGDTTYTDYGLRIIRWGYQGVNAQSAIYHRGTGDMLYYNQESAPHIWYVGGGEKMRIDTSGNLGIGTASPAKEMVLRKDQAAATELSIVNLTSNASASTNLRFRNATSGSESGNGGLIQLANGNAFKIINQFGNPLIFGTSNAEKMRINSSGNVGIGEISIDAKLHLTTASSGLVNQKFESAGSAAWRMGIAAGGTDFLLDDSSDNLSTPEFAFQNDGDFHADGDVIAYSTTTSSDERLKENIKQIPYGLEEVLKMKPVEYDWKEKRGGKHDIGVIAQDIEKLIPEIIKENKDLKTKEDFKSVDYGKMVAVLIKAIQEQQEQIEELKNG